MNTTWRGALEGYEEHLRAGARSPHTIRLRLYWLGRYAAAHDQDPWSITPQQVTSSVAAHDWSLETRRSIRATLNGFYRWAIDAGLTTTNPARSLPTIRPPRRLPRPAPDETTERALKHATPRDRLMLRLAAHCGLRREEISRVQWRDVDGPWLTVHGKGGVLRRVPLPRDLADELLVERRRRALGGLGGGWRYRVDPASPYLFPGLHEGHINVETVGAILRRNLVSCSGHTLRHRFGTRVYRGSHDIRATQELLGHQSILTTQLYTRVEDEDLVDAARWAA